MEKEKLVIISRALHYITDGWESRRVVKIHGIEINILVALLELDGIANGNLDRSDILDAMGIPTA